MWICPNCGRSFKREGQNHACLLIKKENLFEKRPAGLKKLFEKIEEKVACIGYYKQETVLPDVIYFKTKSTFAAVKVKKQHLEVEFFLNRIEDVWPVVKFLQTSKHRVAHVVKLDDEEGLSTQLINWIKESYILIDKS